MFFGIEIEIRISKVTIKTKHGHNIREASQDYKKIVDNWFKFCARWYLDTEKNYARYYKVKDIAQIVFFYCIYIHFRFMIRWICSNNFAIIENEESQTDEI